MSKPSFEFRSATIPHSTRIRATGSFHVFLDSPEDRRFAGDLCDWLRERVQAYEEGERPQDSINAASVKIPGQSGPKEAPDRMDEAIENYYTRKKQREAERQRACATMDDPQSECVAVASEPAAQKLADELKELRVVHVQPYSDERFAIVGQVRIPTRKDVAVMRCELFNRLYPVGALLDMPGAGSDTNHRLSAVEEPARVIDPDGECPCVCVVMKHDGHKHFVSLAYVLGHCV